ncbi:MAG TPA: hypothetical protein VLI90_13885, partial [Tepidisphaeraceae bacterium]|nr:hypothetical protein [Tepidisphaeraceae bacterium]
RATGAIWGYGGTFEQYQKTMVHPSRGIYRVYTHTDGSFVPPVDEVQGHAPQATPRTEPGPEVLRQASVRVNKSLDDCLKSTKPLNQMQVQFLAKAYTVPGTPAFHSAVAVERIVTSIDDLYRRWRSDPEALWQDKATWNPGWFGVGPAGDAVRRLHEQLEPALNQNLDGNTSRRTGWSAMFQASRDWLRDNRRWLTNQAMFTDTNLYLCNRAVAAIDPSHALPEDRALDYLYQSVGLVPWLGRDTPQGPEKLFGSAFYQVTSKGLTRERGYVGSYGEGGVEGAIDIYNATRESDGAGDPKIKAQLIKMLRARGPFRYPMLDEENHPAMRLETTVGWRDTHEPGDVTYAQRVGNDHSALEAAVMTMDPVVIGYVQQMFADNQFFAAVAHHLKDTRLRGTIGLLDESAQYQLMSAQPATGHKLPMSWDQPDFVFSDEEDGVVAIKHGDEILYASLYWRAGYGVNSLARAHYLTPDYQQVAVVHEQAITPNIGHAYKRPDWINFGFGDGGTHIRYPADVHQAYAGEELPIAPIPADVKTKPGEESHFAGRADFYTLRFGQYLIAMNTTADRSFDLPEPDGSAEADDLVAGKRVKLSKSMPIGPKSTAVFYIAHQEPRTK